MCLESITVIVGMLNLFRGQPNDETECDDAIRHSCGRCAVSGPDSFSVVFPFTLLLMSNLSPLAPGFCESDPPSRSVLAESSLRACLTGFCSVPAPTGT